MLIHISIACQPLLWNIHLIKGCDLLIKLCSTLINNSCYYSICELVTLCLMNYCSAENIDELFANRQSFSPQIYLIFNIQLPLLGHSPNFLLKNVQILKFTNVFSQQCFPLHGIYFSTNQMIWMFTWLY